MILGFLLIQLPIIIIVSVIIYLVLMKINRKKSTQRPMIRHIAVVGLIVNIVGIIYLTIFWGGISFLEAGEKGKLNLIPFIWMRNTYTMGSVEQYKQLMLNVAMVIPLGFMFPVVFLSLRKIWKLISVILPMIISIEVIQYFTCRSADIDDLITNVLGGIIGYMIFKILNQMLKKVKVWKGALNG